MATHFHTLRVKQVQREIIDAVSIELEIPDDLQNQFRFEAGQYLTFRIMLDGNEVRRSYSLCAAPHEGILKVAVKQVEGGLFSTYANEKLMAGDVLEVMPPMGKFTLREDARHPNYLAIAAGSGITPMLSIIKHALHSDPNSSFTLIYGNRNSQRILFFEELEALKNKYMGRVKMIHVLSREQQDAEVLNGRIDALKLNALSGLVDFTSFSSAYLCGPEMMIHQTADFLKGVGMNERSIHFELFTTAGAQAKSTKIEAGDAATERGPVSRITLTLDGRTTQFELPQKGQSILDAALKEGADLPYACKGGVCCTCRAKLLKGEVRMDVNYALEPEEVEQGFILTCQSHPISEEVEIDFDVK